MNVIEYFNDIHIIQIGAGGTGSWLVPLVSKLINNIKLRIREDQKITYNIIDSDIVEERNILRQNFTSWDIYKNKAQALVNRYSEDFPEIKAINKYIKTENILIDLLYKIDIVCYISKTHSDNFPNLIEKLSECETTKHDLMIFLGCVDNNKTRRIIFKTLKKLEKRVPTRFVEYYNDGFILDGVCERSIIYIDSGNSLYNGQIATTKFYANDIIKDNNSKKLNFLKMFPIEQQEQEAQSCAFFGDQSQCVNNLAASLVFANLQKILVNNELPPNLIEFNSSGFCNFKI